MRNLCQPGVEIIQHRLGDLVVHVVLVPLRHLKYSTISSQHMLTEFNGCHGERPAYSLVVEERHSVFRSLQREGIH